MWWKGSRPIPARFFRDPPELVQFAQRGDPPMDKWPGRLVGREDLMRASGDQRDWFRYGHRLQAHTRATQEFITGRRVRRDMSADFNWNQILVLGDYGAGKTTTAIKMA